MAAEEGSEPETEEDMRAPSDVGSESESRASQRSRHSLLEAARGSQGQAGGKVDPDSDVSELSPNSSYGISPSPDRMEAWYRDEAIRSRARNLRNAARIQKREAKAKLRNQACIEGEDHDDTVEVRTPTLSAGAIAKSKDKAQPAVKAEAEAHAEPKANGKESIRSGPEVVLCPSSSEEVEEAEEAEGVEEVEALSSVHSDDVEVLSDDETCRRQEYRAWQMIVVRF